MKSKRFAIVDIETTGGLYNRDKIIEIAIVVTDGHSVLKEFESLINPDRSIPSFITGITGITDEMVRDAPRFYEIAKEIIECTDQCIFVAHNARFDYSFIKEEFKSLGYPYNKKTLCTVKLSRTLVPEIRKYGLDKLIQHFNIPINNRHRAYGDAYATYLLFKLLNENQTDDYHIKKIINQGIDESVLPKSISIDDIHQAPETPGVYYLSDNSQRILYVGKAKDIKTRVFQHFRALSRKSINIHNMVGGFHYTETGSELIALLLELYEIKTLKPELNKSLKNTNYSYGLYINHAAIGLSKYFIVTKNNQKNASKYELIKLFSSKQSADSYVQQLILENHICIHHTKSSNKQFFCHCEEGCTNLFIDLDHIKSLVNDIKNEFDNDFVIITSGRTDHEQGIVMIKEKKFYGFGYFNSKEDSISNKADWDNFITHKYSYPEANGIIKNLLAKNRLKIVTLD